MAEKPSNNNEMTLKKYIEKQPIELKSFDQIFDTKGKTISMLNKQFGGVKQQLAVMLYGFQESYNVQHKMDNDQVIECASAIITEFPDITLDDVHKFCKEATTGKYGKVYNRIDKEMVCLMMDEYMYQRNIALEAYRKPQHASLKDYDEKVLTALKNAAERIKTPEKPKPKTESYETHAEFLRQNIHLFTDEQLEKQINQYKMGSGSGAFDELIEICEQEQQARKDNKHIKDLL